MSTGNFIERRFRRSGNRATGQDEEILVWEDLAHEHVVVVLGDPGQGKTTEFERQAAREPSTSLLSIRKFLRLSLQEPQLRAGTLYLDGLDEARADGSKHGVLDSIIQRLVELGRPRVRLSCREADWFGELDRRQMADVAPSFKITVVELQPPFRRGGRAIHSGVRPPRPEPLPPDVKRAVLFALESLADREPWFLYGGEHLRAFGTLSDAALIPQFREAFVRTEKPVGYRLAVLATLAYGRPVQELKGDLLEVARKGDPGAHVHDLGIQALINVASDESEMLSWLEGVQAGRIADPRSDFRAHLLRRLYPVVIDPSRVASYLIPPDVRVLGNYYYFLAGGLGSQTPDEGLPDLLEGLSSVQPRPGREDEGVWQDLLGPVLVRALEGYGESIRFGRLWAWLQLSHDDLQSTLKGEHQQAIRRWFSERPSLVSALYQWWVLKQVESGLELWSDDFWSALCRPERPPDLWRWQLAMAETWTGEPKGEALFRHAVDSWKQVGLPSLEELFSWVDRHPEYRETLGPLLVSKVRLRPLLEDLDSRRKRNREVLEKHLERIRAGDHSGCLKFLAKRFLSSGNAATGAARLERIRQEFGPEIAVAAATGFMALVYRSDLPSPHEVAEAAGRNQCSNVRLPLLAGVTLLYDERWLPGLNCSGVRTALAFEFAYGTHLSIHWFDPVIAEDSAVAAEIINAVWRALLQRRAEFIPYLYLGTEQALRSESTRRLFALVCFVGGSCGNGQAPGQGLPSSVTSRGCLGGTA